MITNTRIKITPSLIAAITLVIAGPVLADDGEKVYNATCKLCHGEGIKMSPRVGDPYDWEERIAKGMKSLYSNAINGFKDIGKMPARGGNKKLTDDEVKSAVDYMVEQSR